MVKKAGDVVLWKEVLDRGQVRVDVPGNHRNLRIANTLPAHQLDNLGGDAAHLLVGVGRPGQNHPAVFPRKGRRADGGDIFLQKAQRLILKAGRLRQRVGAIVGDLLVLCPAQHLQKGLPRHRKGPVRKRLPVVHLGQGVQRKADLHALALGKHQLQQLFLPGHKGHKGIDKDDAVPKISPALQQRTAAHDPVLLVLKLAFQQRLIGLVDPGHLLCLLRQLWQAGLPGKKPQLIRQDTGVFKLVNLAQHRPHKGGVFGLAGVQL